LQTASNNVTTRFVDGEPYTLNYDAENRLVSAGGAATASFVYDGDGKQIKASVNGTTTVYVGNHYEVKSGVVTKYYFAGTTRLAVRTGGTLSYLLSDHLGSSSVTTDANGAKTASALYKAFGETRYTLGNLGTDYQFTGQRLQAELGIYWFQSRWMDPLLGRFAQPDTIVPTSTQGTQAWDRYAFVNNNPVRYNDLTGHSIDEKDSNQEKENEEDIQTDGQQGPTTCGDKDNGIACESFVGVDGATYYRVWQNGTEMIVPYNEETDSLIEGFMRNADNYDTASDTLNGSIAVGVGSIITMGASAVSTVIGAATIETGLGLILLGAGIVGLVGSTIALAGSAYVGVSVNLFL
jgi:RHS repeat-associated protein